MHVEPIPKVKQYENNYKSTNGQAEEKRKSDRLEKEMWVLFLRGPSFSRHDWVTWLIVAVWGEVRAVYGIGPG